MRASLQCLIIACLMMIARSRALFSQFVKDISFDLVQLQYYYTVHIHLCVCVWLSLSWLRT